MAVNDEALTEKIKKAADYFAELEKECLKNSKDVNAHASEVNGEQLLCASFAASVFDNVYIHGPIRKELEEKIGVDELSVTSDMSGGVVRDVCGRYTKGNKKISAYEAKHAAIICSALLSYVEISEKTTPSSSIAH